jgi:hypothetical protein
MLVGESLTRLSKTSSKEANMAWDAGVAFGKVVTGHGIPAIINRLIDSKFAVTVGGSIIKLVGTFHDMTGKAEIVPLDEPLFLVRARDHLAVQMLTYYRELCALDQCTDWQIEGVTKTIEIFNDFAKDHPERMKQPGVSRGL